MFAVVYLSHFQETVLTSGWHRSNLSLHVTTTISVCVYADASYCIWGATALCHQRERMFSEAVAWQLSLWRWRSVGADRRCICERCSVKDGIRREMFILLQSRVFVCVCVCVFVFVIVCKDEGRGGRRLELRSVTGFLLFSELTEQRLSYRWEVNKHTEITLPSRWEQAELPGDLTTH